MSSDWMFNNGVDDDSDDGLYYKKRIKDSNGLIYLRHNPCWKPKKD